jgi:hypothetical protein
MITINDALRLEHVFLRKLFQEVDQLLPEVQTLGEVRLLCRIIESLLAAHGDVEQNLAYSALDQGLAERGELAQLYQDHEEIDGRFERARMARSVLEARRLLKEGLSFSICHFQWEEDSVFPLFDQVFSPSTLEAFAVVAQSRASV